MSDLAPDGPAEHARTMIPMKTLYERIDHVRSSRKDLPLLLRNIAAEIPGSWTRKSLLGLASAMENNASAAELVAKFPHHCWLLTLQSSAATTDALTAMLEQAAYQNRLRTKKIRTIAYPLVLLLIAVAFLILALALLIPPFDEMYQEFSLQLPTPTLALVNASRWVNGHPFGSLALLGLLIAAVTAALWFWISDNAWKQTFFTASVSGPAMRQTLAKVAMQIAELTDEGVKLTETLKIAAESAPEPIMRRLIGDLAIQANQDVSRLQSTRAAMIFPPNFLLALYPAASDSGSNRTTPNTTMLRALAASYRDLSIRRKDWIGFALGQITVVGVGLMIAFTVLALFAPLVSLVSALSY